MRLFQALLGLVLGFAIAELVFTWRDAGAFPHLNIYVPDPTLGVRLEKNARTKLRVATNPVVTIHTNDQGYRGEAWPPSRADDVLVVGDSQVFGLGVQDHETFSARLHVITGRTVLNAGVPTYGPQEYTAIIREIMAQRPVKDVVFVMNVANDLFERERPNTERHVVWDGWAVRKETAPENHRSGWVWPMQRSHLVFAARSFFARPVNDDAGQISEGAWSDLQDDAASAPTEPQTPALEARIRERNAVAAELRALGSKLELAFSVRTQDDEAYRETAKKLARYEGDARDIVANPYAEAARPVDITAWQLWRAALPMEANDAALRQLAERTNDAELTRTLDNRAELRARLRALSGEPEHAHTPVDKLFHDVVNAAGTARVTFLILPLDVQVSTEEWAKYQKPARDMEPTLALNRMLVRAALQAGARAYDPLTALRAAEPGAFLVGDLHMSAKGHSAIAEGLAAELVRTSDPAEANAPALAPGRSWPPLSEEWAAASTLPVPNAAEALCEIKSVREWIGVRCIGRYAREGENAEQDARLLVPMRVSLQQGGHGDAYAAADGTTLELVLPVLEGDDAAARLGWSAPMRREKGRAEWRGQDRLLRIVWPGGGERQISLSAPEPRSGDEPPSGAFPQEIAVRLVARQPLDPDCGAAKQKNGGCLMDLPTRPVTCGAGEIAFGALRRCRPDCGNMAACKGGRCERWLRESACVVP